MTDETASGQADVVPSAGALEELWAGEFGDAYVGRNSAAVDARAAFWQRIAQTYPFGRALEVGCANGENLRHLAKLGSSQDLWGVDINEQALATARKAVPGVNAVWGAARELPFRDRHFDLVFTVALLIHQPDSTLPIVMSEIVRCSNRWVLCGEYMADETTDVNYRGRAGILLKRDYGRLYQELFPDLTLREQGFLAHEDGFDRVTYWVFERTR
jgi:pseudaminic acid biosynthesis-associated methylase